ncbi:LOW QUALITY PROTEIN: protein FAM200C-like [Scylla paramamosain]|uniref:LOW QUALITY PROTEIN: protein FAM200C-like n=1 Tax=Scylla paramamosain TaxID=85552 RepID=UPI0030827B0D
MKLDSSSVFHQETWKLVEASYELSLLIAKAKKPHSVGETLVKPCLLSAANTVLGEESQRKLSKISLSDNTAKRRIDELSEDIKEQVLDKIKASRFFAIQCDESTDVVHLCQLLVYSRFVDEGTVKEEILFSAALEATAKAIDVFSKVDEFFQEHSLSWEKLVGVCTDGAPSMIGSRSGFVKLVKEKNPAVTGTHCVIHRQSLASKTLPSNLRSSLNLAIKVVNFVKHSSLNSRLFAALCSDLGTDYKTLLFHTEVRWLSKGNMLSRLYELKDEVEIFLQKQKQDKLYEAFREEDFQLSLAYLVDFFEAINNLNLKLQGRNTNIIAHSDVIRAFTKKIHLWKRKVQVGNFSSFSHLNELFTDVELLLESLQEEAINLKCDSSAKRDFETMKLEEFWVKYLPMYPKVGEEALRVILPFSSTYLCEAGFSALVVLKTKQRNRLDVENDLSCALSSFNPRISDLVRKKQQHPSH